jgi:predicted RNA polymerase sigma factor
MCAEAIRLTELLLDSRVTAHAEVHALAALFCFNAARLSTRLDEEGVLLPLADQARHRWDRAMIERAVVHLAASSHGPRITRWHLEAGIACEHTLAASTQDTDWSRIVQLYEALDVLTPGPIVALNRALDIAELQGLEAGRAALLAIADHEKLSNYHFFWAALADIERRAGRPLEAKPLYLRAISLARNEAERLSYQRRLRLLEN